MCVFIVSFDCYPIYYQDFYLQFLAGFLVQLSIEFQVDFPLNFLDYFPLNFLDYFPRYFLGFFVCRIHFHYLQSLLHKDWACCGIVCSDSKHEDEIICSRDMDRFDSRFQNLI